MKKLLSTLLTAALLVGTLALGAVGASGAELTADKGTVGAQNNTCGFIDSNLRFSESLNVDSLSDITIEINGKPAYWNIGYQGQKHCQLGAQDGVEKAWIQVGIVGAEIVAGENTLKLTMGDSGDTYEQTFTAGFTSRGVVYSKVDADKTAATVTAVITYNEDPGYAVGDELEGKCHDDHGGSFPDNRTTFTVTKVEGNTVTLSASDYVPAQSLLELKDADGVYTTVTINTAKVIASDPQALADEDTAKVVAEGTKLDLTNVASVETANSSKTFGDASKLTNGVGEGTGKLEGGFPTGGITITFETESAVKATYLVLYTGNDDASYNNRAPQSFKLYGSADGSDYTVIKDVATSGIKNENYAPFAFALNSAEYKYYKLEIHSNLGAGHFQMGELELYSGSVAVSGVPAEGTRTEILGYDGAYTGIDPETGEAFTPDEPDPDEPGPDEPDPGETDPGETEPEPSETTPEVTTGTEPSTGSDDPETTTAPTTTGGSTSTPTTTASTGSTGSSNDDGGSALPIIIAVIAVVVIGGAAAVVVVVVKKKKA